MSNADPVLSDILCLGEALVEFSQADEAATAATRGLPVYLQAFGGDTSNVAIAVARQGGRAGYVTRVGRDAFGGALLDLWRREGVSAAHVEVDPSAPTGAYFITHGDDGHAFTYLRTGSPASRMTPALVPQAALSKARILHVSGISQAISASAADTVFAAMASARAAGVLVSYDSNLRLRLWPIERARAITNAAMREADIALPGLDDARHLLGLEDADAIADHYLAGRARVVALTLGRDGALIATREARRRVPSIAVEAVDASGAGDCFDGAFLVEWLRTGDAFAAGRYACVAAALSTRGKGAITPIPCRAEVEAALRGAAT